MGSRLFSNVPFSFVLRTLRPQNPNNRTLCQFVVTTTKRNHNYEKAQHVVYPMPCQWCRQETRLLRAHSLPTMRSRASRRGTPIVVRRAHAQVQLLLLHQQIRLGRHQSKRGSGQMKTTLEALGMVLGYTGIVLFTWGILG